MWFVTRIYYYAEEKEQLVLDCVRPLFKTLQEEGLITQGYFLRRWQRGPHICLYLQSEPSQLALVQARIEAVVSGYLTSHPSRRILREEEVRSNYERLASLEKVSGPLFPLRADNSLVFEDDDMQAAPYGGQVGLDLMRMFLSESTPIVFRLLEQTQDNKAALLSQFFSWMLLTAASLGDIRKTYISYRSHAEGFLNGYDPKGRLRQQFDQQYEKQAAALRNMAQSYLTATQGERGELDASWQQLLERFVPQLQQAILAGSINLPLPVPKKGSEEWQRMSKFHQMAYSIPRLLDYMYTPAFATRRFLLNLLYEVMLQCGIRPLEKCFLCYMVASAVEDATGTPWEALMK